MKQKLAEWINVLFGFRKFLLMLVLFVVGIVFRIKGYISGGEFVDLFKNTTVAFMAANGIEHLVATVKDVMGNKNTQQTQALADGNESNDNNEVEIQ